MKTPALTSAYIFDKNVQFKFSRGKTFRVPKDRPVLSILIPTYNRAAKLDPTLGRLAACGIGSAADVEIVVAVNPSGDGSYEKAMEWQEHLPRLRCVEHATYVGSAEENIDRSVCLAQGEFVWLLGDDDAMQGPIFWLLRSIVASGEVDVCIANFRLQNDPKLTNGVKGFIEMDGPLVEINYPEWVKACGLTTSAAFISIYCFRRSLFRSYADLIAASPIYAHVFGFLRMFARARVKFLGYRLVMRRVPADHIGGFVKFTKERGESVFAPWTSGLMRLVDAAVERGIIDREFFSEVVERGHLRAEYELQGEIANQLCRQMQSYIASRNSHDLPKPDTIAKFVAYSRGQSQVAGHRIRQIRNALVLQSYFKPRLWARVMPVAQFAEQQRALNDLIHETTTHVTRPHRWHQRQGSADQPPTDVSRAYA